MFFFEKAIQNNIFEYVGFVKDVSDILIDANCLVLPSYREGSSRAILEAMSMKLPVITSDVPGCNNLVEDGVTGFLSKSMDSRALSGI